MDRMNSVTFFGRFDNISFAVLWHHFFTDNLIWLLDKSPEHTSGTDAKPQQESTQNDSNSNASSESKTNTENTENKDKAQDENKQNENTNNTNAESTEQPRTEYKPPFPPVQPLSPFFFGLAAVVLFIYLYTFFGINGTSAQESSYHADLDTSSADDNINEFLELSKHAGPAERAEALMKFKRYLTYDRKSSLCLQDVRLTCHF